MATEPKPTDRDAMERQAEIESKGIPADGGIGLFSREGA